MVEMKEIVHLGNLVTIMILILQAISEELIIIAIIKVMWLIKIKKSLNHKKNILEIFKPCKCNNKSLQKNCLENKYNFSNCGFYNRSKNNKRNYLAMIKS